MSRWTPCKRRDFIRRLRVPGFDGPLAGTGHSLAAGFPLPSGIPPENTKHLVDLRRQM
jgi:hypothetical protein